MCRLDAPGFGRQCCDVGLERVGFDNVEPIGIGADKFAERLHATAVALDGNNLLRSGLQQRPGQAARAGTDFDDVDTRKIPRRPGDARAQTEVEKKMLAQGPTRAQIETSDDAAERR